MNLLFLDVFVLSPLNDYNMSNVTIMFNSSGVGVQVECMYGLMHVRAAAPYSMFVSGQEQLIDLYSLNSSSIQNNYFLNL